MEMGIQKAKAPFTQEPKSVLENVFDIFRDAITSPDARIVVHCLHGRNRSYGLWMLFHMVRRNILDYDKIFNQYQKCVANLRIAYKSWIRDLSSILLGNDYIAFRRRYAAEDVRAQIVEKPVQLVGARILPRRRGC